MLSEILLSTEGKSPEEIAAVQKKAEDLRNRVIRGDDFNEIAKRYSEGSTAKDGGDLGTFKRGEMAPQLEEVVFKMDKGQITDVIQTKPGFEILKVDQSLSGRLAAPGQSGKRNHEPVVHAENAAADARLPGDLARGKLCDGKAGLHGQRGRGRSQRDPGSAADARHGAEKERKEESAAAQSQRSMKSHYVSDLQDGQAVTSLFLVGVKEIRTSQRSGKSWLELALRDKTGSIPAKMWDNFETLAKTFEADDVVQIRGRVKLYNGQKEMTLEQIVPAADRDYDLSDFIAHTRHDVEKLYGELGAAVAAVKNPWIKQLLGSVIE